MTTPIGSLRINQRFNGPAGSGNGGYSCGLMAAHIDGPATARLHAPPPLDTPLALSRAGNGQIKLHDGEQLVGSAWKGATEIDIPPAPSLEQAEDASNRYPCYEGHLYPTCFVCGPDRHENDGLCIYPGPVENWDLLACPWQPAADLLNPAGHVKTEFLWSALDCPGCFAAVGPTMPAVLLGELSAQLRPQVPGTDTLIVYSWPLGREGRKFFGATAIADQAGEVMAWSKSTWILLKK